MSPLVDDLRHSLRVLRKTPGLTALAILTLAWGIGSCTSAFSLINAFLLRPLPFPDAGRLVHVWATDRVQHEPRVRVSVPDYLDFRDRSRDVADLAAFTYREATLTTGAEPETLAACNVSGNTFQVLGVNAANGRTLGPDDARPGRTSVVVVSTGLWKRRFGGQPLIGRTIDLDGVPHTVVGIMSESFAFPLNTTDVWIPQVFDTVRYTRGRRFLQVVGRLKAGVSREQAQLAMRDVARRLEQEHPVEDGDHGVRVVPLREGLNVAFETIVPMAVVLAFTNLIVLLIVCANVAGLALASAIARTREIAIRLSLGSSRLRVMRQLLVQSVVMALPGGALGVLLANWSVEAAARSIPPELYRVGAISVDERAFWFALGLSALSAFVFGIAPAWRASRTKIADQLKDDAPSARGGVRSARFRGVLVLSQVALGAMLVMAATVLLVTLARLQHVDPGFAPDGVLTLKLRLPATRYTGDAQLASFDEELLARVRALPSVSSAAVVSTLPLDHETAEVEFSTASTPATDTKLPVANVATVSPGYFETLSIPIVAGHGITTADVSSGQAVAVVNRTLADKWLHGNAALDRRLRIKSGGGGWRELHVAGIAADARQDALAGDVRPQIYLSQLQTPTRYLALAVRSAGADGMALAPPVRAIIRELDAALPVTGVRPLRSLVEAFVAPQRSMAAAVGRLALGALLLVLVGVYGIVAHAVAQRTYEIGLRMALGAPRGAVLVLIARQAMWYLVPGLLLGLAGAILLGRVLSHVIPGAATANVLIAAVVMAIVALVAVLAGWVPARRALAIDPVGALRSS
jgi:putative ABC transport system permease protein